MKAFYIFLSLTFFSIASLNGQSSVYGKITDKKTGEEILYANIVLNKNGVFAAGGPTDFEGNYSIPLAPGTYEMKIFYPGYADHLFTDIIVKKGQGTKHDYQLDPSITIGPIISTNCWTPKNHLKNLKTDRVISSLEKNDEDKLSLNPYLYGKVTDKETGEELLYVNIVLRKNENFVTGTSTDFEGNYSMPVASGTYDVLVSYTGYPDHLITDIKIKTEEGTKLDIFMTHGIELSSCPPFTSITIPLLDQDPSPRGKQIPQEEIRNQPQKTINQLLLNTPGVSLTNY